MAPKNLKPSAMMKRCNVAVIGSMGKDAKLTDIEKWIVNNGGTFTKSISSKTTHVLCTWDTFRANDFALHKQYQDRKRLHFVSWDWLDKTLNSRKVQPPGRFKHTRVVDLPATKKNAIKKNAKRQALLTEDVKELERVATDKLDKSRKRAKVIVHEDEEDANDDELIEAKKRKRSFSRSSTVSYMDKPDINFEPYIDADGVAWSVHLMGASLPEPEEFDYHVYITVANTGDDVQYYKAQYTYTNGVDESTLSLWTGPELVQNVAQFKGFYKNKTGEDWAIEHHRRKLAALASISAFDDTAAQYDYDEVPQDKMDDPSELDIKLMQRYAENKHAKVVDASAQSENKINGLELPEEKINNIANNNNLDLIYYPHAQHPSSEDTKIELPSSLPSTIPAHIQDLIPSTEKVFPPPPPPPPPPETTQHTNPFQAINNRFPMNDTSRSTPSSNTIIIGGTEISKAALIMQQVKKVKTWPANKFKPVNILVEGEEEE